MPGGRGGIARRTSPIPRTTFLPVGDRHETVGSASVIEGSLTTVCCEHATNKRMPSLGDVLKQANAPTPAPPVPRAGLHKAFPKETRGIKKSAALQRHEPFAQHPEWAPRDYRTQSQAAFDAHPVARNAERPTLSTEMLQRSSIVHDRSHMTEKALTSTTDRNYAETLRAHGARPKHRQPSGRAGPTCVTPQMRLTSKDLQFHTRIFRSDSEEDRFVTQMREAHRDMGTGHRPPASRTRQDLFRSHNVADAIALGESDRFVTETRRHFVTKDPRDIEDMVHAGDARRFSAFDRVKASRESWD